MAVWIPATRLKVVSSQFTAAKPKPREWRPLAQLETTRAKGPFWEGKSHHQRILPLRTRATFAPNQGAHCNASICRGAPIRPLRAAAPCRREGEQHRRVEENRKRHRWQHLQQESKRQHSQSKHEGRKFKERDSRQSAEGRIPVMPDFRGQGSHQDEKRRRCVRAAAGKLVVERNRERWERELMENEDKASQEREKYEAREEDCEEESDTSLSSEQAESEEDEEERAEESSDQEHERLDKECSNNKVPENEKRQKERADKKTQQEQDARERKRIEEEDELEIDRLVREQLERQCSEKERWESVEQSEEIPAVWHVDKKQKLGGKVDSADVLYSHHTGSSDSQQAPAPLHLGHKSTAGSQGNCSQAHSIDCDPLRPAAASGGRLPMPGVGLRDQSTKDGNTRRSSTAQEWLISDSVGLTQQQAAQIISVTEAEDIKDLMYLDSEQAVGQAVQMAGLKIVPAQKFRRALEWLHLSRSDSVHG